MRSRSRPRSRDRASGPKIEIETEIEGTSGEAAIGILMTLSQKRTIDSARGSFLGKELPTGLRLADGN